MQDQATALLQSLVLRPLCTHVCPHCGSHQQTVFEAQSIPVVDPGSSLPPVASCTENEKCTRTCTILTSAAVALGYLFYIFLSRCCLAAVSCVLASPLHQFHVGLLGCLHAPDSGGAASRGFSCLMGIMGSGGTGEEHCSTN